MKSIVMAIMAVAVAVTFSAPSFAGDEKKDKKDEKKGGQVLVYADDTGEKKDQENKGPKQGGNGDMKDEKKKDEKDK